MKRTTHRLQRVQTRPLRTCHGNQVPLLTRLRFIAVLLALWALAVVALPARADAGPGRQANPVAPVQPPVAMSGYLAVIHADAPDGAAANVIHAYLIGEQGATRLGVDAQLLAPGGAVAALDRQMVAASGVWIDHEGSLQLDVRAIAPLRATSVAQSLQRTLVGPQPWVSILCAFPDVQSELQPLSYFQTMLDSTFPHLNDYWRQLSNGAISLDGSDARGWYTLPQQRSYYVTAGGPQFDRLITDCSAAADADVDFRDFAGINLMFSSDLDGSAAGGSWYLELDGQKRVWYATWEPPWAYRNLAAITHEMGHGFGLAPSRGESGSEYASPWDVMSDPWRNCALLTDPLYGCIAQGTTGFNKYLMGWISSGQTYVAPANSERTVTLERLALPQSNVFRLAIVPIGGTSTRYYTIEARRSAGYDARLPRHGVLIHNVDLQRQYPPALVDANVNGDSGDEGSVWTVGETYVDAVNATSIAVVAETNTGYVVTIRQGTPLTATPSPTNPPADTATPTATRTVTATPTRTNTRPPATATNGATASATATWTRTPTVPPSATATPMASPTGTPTPSLSPDLYERRVNAGGGAFTGSTSATWRADRAYLDGAWGYVGGRSVSATLPISNTQDEALFQKARVWDGWDSPGYRFTVPDGQYEVTLFFAETQYARAGQRQFNVRIGDDTVLTAFDVLAVAGPQRVVQRTFTTTVSGSVLSITFCQIDGRGEPFVNAVEVRQLAP